MLDEIKKSYEVMASFIPQWKKLGRSELCRRYVKAKAESSPLADNYLGAIVCSFWNLVEHNYYSQQRPMATPEDCYAWVVDSILYALDKHVWNDLKSPLFDDPNGPEKAINVTIKSERANYYVSQNRIKRKIALQSISLDGLQEAAGNLREVEKEDTYSVHSDFIDNLVKKYYTDLEYCKAFALYLIVTTDFCLPTKPEEQIGEFDMLACKKAIRGLDDADCDMFANAYHFPKSDVERAADIVRNMTYYAIEKSINQMFSSIRKDKVFVSLLRSTNLC